MMDDDGTIMSNMVTRLWYDDFIIYYYKVNNG